MSNYVYINELEFFWSPFFGKRYRTLEETVEIPLLFVNIMEILQDMPKLVWLHLTACVEGVE